MNDLDPQVKALLEQFQASAKQHPAPLTPPSAQEKLIQARQRISGVATLGPPSEPVSKTKDFEIPTPAGRLLVRLYVPLTKEPMPVAAPIFVFNHGGGFIGGSLESHDTLLRAIANRAHCLILSVGYRLAPEDPYPAANEDAWSALAWVADHASEIGADPQRIAIGGDSAGGLLAAWVAQKAAKTGPKLRLQVLLYPNLDATASRPSWKELGTGTYLLAHAQMMEWYDAFLPHRINREDPKVSPLFATDFTHIAPALIVTADHDPLHDEGEEYAAKLKAANVAVDYTCWPGMIHSFATFAGVLDAGKVVIDQVGAALRKAFE